MDVEVFVNDLVKNGNDYEKYKSSDFKLVLKLYKNGFLIEFVPEIEKDKINMNKFYFFSDTHSIELFNKIKSKQLPKEIIPKILSFDKVKNLCLVIEDYSRTDYFKVDDNSEKTKITIRLLNGKTLTNEYNLIQTVNNIKESIQDKTILPKEQYTFVYGFPPKEIEEEQFTMTIKDLKIENSTLTQKIISLYK